MNYFRPVPYIIIPALPDPALKALMTNVFLIKGGRRYLCVRQQSFLGISFSCPDCIPLLKVLLSLCLCLSLYLSCSLKHKYTPPCSQTQPLLQSVFSPCGHLHLCFFSTPHLILTLTYPWELDLCVKHAFVFSVYWML